VIAPPTLEEIRLAAARIRPHVRRTPALDWRLPDGVQVRLKLEFLQVGGSFKARGACNRVLSAADEEVRRGVITASGGNHGLGVAYAASRRNVSATVFLPESAPQSTEKRLGGFGARVIRGGRTWDDAWQLAVAEAERAAALLLHPFEDREVICGQATLALELIEDAPDLDLAVVAVGGGGLIAGVGAGLRALRPAARLVGVEPSGATSMRDSLKAGRVITLERVDTIAGTLAPRAIGPNTLALATRLVERVVLVTDDELRAAMRRLWDELRILVEPAGAAAVAALCGGHVRIGDARSIVALVCGANLDAHLAAEVVGA
jgi:threonine dehydratase